MRSRLKLAPSILKGSGILDAYRSLEARFRRMAALKEAAGILHWDMATLMPEGGAAARGEQLAVLDVLSHELLTDPRVAEDLTKAEGKTSEFDSWQQTNLAEMRRLWAHANAVPADLVEALSKSANRCQMIWREARPASDFPAIRPALEELLGLVRKQATAKSEALGHSPYNALLDLYEPGASSAQIDDIFDDLAGFLPGFLASGSGT